MRSFSLLFPPSPSLPFFVPPARCGASGRLFFRGLEFWLPRAPLTLRRRRFLLIRHVGRPEALEFRMRRCESAVLLHRDAPTATNEFSVSRPPLPPFQTASSFRTGHQNFATGVVRENYRGVTTMRRNCARNARKRGQDARMRDYTAADGAAGSSPSAPVGVFEERRSDKAIPSRCATRYDVYTTSRSDDLMI